MNENETSNREVMADLDAVLEHVFSGTAIEPDLAHRVQERSEQVQKMLREKHGQVDVAVDLIREIRDEE